MAYAYEPGLAQPRKGADEDANILKEFKVGPFPPLPPCPLLSAFALAAGLLDTDTNRKHDASPHPLVRCSPIVRLPTPSPALRTRCCRPSDVSRQAQTAPLTLPHKLNLSCSHACGSPPPHESDARSHVRRSADPLLSACTRRTQAAATVRRLRTLAQPWRFPAKPRTLRSARVRPGCLSLATTAHVDGSQPQSRFTAPSFHHAARLPETDPTDPPACRPASPPPLLALPTLFRLHMTDQPSASSPRMRRTSATSTSASRSSSTTSRL